MRPIVVLGLIALMASAGFGQRPGGAPLGNPLGNPLPPIRPIPPAGGSPRPQFAPQPHQRGMRSSGFYSLPYYPAAYYPGPYSDFAPPAPSVTIIQQFAPPPVIAVEPTVTAHIQEYSPSAVAPAPGSEPAMFAIVFKDGSVLPAAAVMTQGGALQIVDADGQHRRIPLSSIDRDATRRRNAERNLRLQLPAPTTP